jgi:hypothetical protein
LQGGGKKREGVGRKGGQRGEMAQTMYAHMSKQFLKIVIVERNRFIIKS